MSDTRTLRPDQPLRPSENYVVGCFGAAGLIIGASEWARQGLPLGWMPSQAGYVLAWSGLLLLQLLTLYALKRRLTALGRSVRWAGLILVLWVGFDVPLVASRHAYILLPLLYGASQVIFLFNLRKVQPKEEIPEPKVES